MTQSRLLKKIVLVHALLSAIATNSVQADEYDEIFPDDKEPVTHYQQEPIGLGAGGIVGGVLGGPPGLIIGAFGGAIFGRNAGMQEDLQRTKIALEESRLQLEEQQQMTAAVRSELESEHKQESNQILLASANHIKPGISGAFEQYLANTIEKTITLNIQFRTNSDQLEPHFKDQLQQLSATLQMVPGLHIHLSGYADPRGTDQYNYQLSNQRIETVRQILMAAGVSDNRIKVRAFGEYHPLTAKQDGESYDFERRVLISFENTGEIR
jgi:sortase system peptidoglycan-associated protein